MGLAFRENKIVQCSGGKLIGFPHWEFDYINGANSWSVKDTPKSNYEGTIRVEVEDSAECGGSNDLIQSGLAYKTICLPQQATLGVHIIGDVETYNDYYDESFISVYSKLTVTSSDADPDVTGTYWPHWIWENVGKYEGLYPVYIREDGNYYIWHDNVGYWNISDTVGNDDNSFYVVSDAFSPNGSYSCWGTWTGSVEVVQTIYSEIAYIISVTENMTDCTMEELEDSGSQELPAGKHIIYCSIDTIDGTWHRDMYSEFSFKLS